MVGNWVHRLRHDGYTVVQDEASNIHCRVVLLLLLPYAEVVGIGAIHNTAAAGVQGVVVGS